jgi:hypothetical protein
MCVDATADVRKPVADFNPALAALGKAGLQRIEPRPGLVQPGNHLAQVLLEQRVLERRVVRRIVEQPPGVLFNSGLGSNDSMWLTPPTMKSQITRLALPRGTWPFSRAPGQVVRETRGG